jgi:hypothetical protein
VHLRDPLRLPRVAPSPAAHAGGLHEHISIAIIFFSLVWGSSKEDEDGWVAIPAEDGAGSTMVTTLRLYEPVGCLCSPLRSYFGDRFEAFSCFWRLPMASLGYNIFIDKFFGWLPRLRLTLSGRVWGCLHPFGRRCEVVALIGRVWGCLHPFGCRCEAVALFGRVWGCCNPFGRHCEVGTLGCVRCCPFSAVFLQRPLGRLRCRRCLSTRWTCRTNRLSMLLDN